MKTSSCAYAAIMQRRNRRRHDHHFTTGSRHSLLHTPSYQRGGLGAQHCRHLLVHGTAHFTCRHIRNLPGLVDLRHGDVLT